MNAGTLAADAELARQLAELQGLQPEQHPERAAVLAKIVVILPQTSDQEAEKLGGSLPVFIPCLQSPDPYVQANACALLTAVASQSEALAAEVCKQAGGELIVLLRSMPPPAAAAAAGGSEGAFLHLPLNLYSALGQLARDSPALASELQQTGNLEAILAACQVSSGAKLQEALADLLCALASPEDSRGRLVDAGAVAAAARLLQAGDLEVAVRALMALGMLVPSSPAAQQQLLGVEGAVACLLQLMRQSEDMDCKIIARDLIGVLTREPEGKAAVEAVVRQQLCSSSGGHQQQQQEEVVVAAAAAGGGQQGG